MMVYYLDVVKMVKELRKSCGEELFVVVVCEVFDVVVELCMD